MIGAVLRVILLILSFVGILYAQSVARDYPSYRYVFSEFDVEPSFIDNEIFVKFVRANERKIKLFYKRSIKRGEILLPILQRKLMDDGLSDLFVYLSMVESGFATDIVSSKKAVGLWQFMPATARSYKLRVCDMVDERCDPDVATDAAIAHLEKLHKKFGKWYLAMMAYNCGEGRLGKAIAQSGSESLEVLIGKESTLPRETRLYIQKILLAAMIGESISLGFEQMPKSKGGKGVMRVTVNGGERWSDLAVLLDMNISALKKLNPTYKGDMLPKSDKNYDIYIPEEKIYSFYLRYELEKHSKILQSDYLLPYEVKLGDTIETIAKVYQSDPESIKAANHKKDEYLEVGEFLVIPVSKEIFETAQKGSRE